MIESKVKDIYLEKVLSSSAFCRSIRNKEVLEYLVQAERQGKLLKEVTLAIDLFNKDESFNPADDTIVRVTIGNIRKKLQHYYLTEGKDDTIHLKIPVGGYDLKFIKENTGSGLKLTKINSGLLLVSLFVALLVIAVLYWQNYQLRGKYHPVESDNIIWGDFINGKSPNLLVIGDYFFMYENYNNYRIFIRDPRTNSLADFKINQTELDENWEPSEFSYIPSTLATTTSDITPVLKMAGQPISVANASELQWDDFNKNNIIYTGTYKAMYIIGDLLKQFNFKVDVDSSYCLLQTDSTGVVVKKYELPRVKQGKYHVDYSFLGKVKGPGNKDILIIASGDNVGLSKVVKIITSNEFSSEIQTYLGKSVKDKSIHFEMIIKTEGFRSTGFKYEVVYFNQL